MTKCTLCTAREWLKRWKQLKTFAIISSNDRLLSQSSEPRWPEGGARGKAWQEDRLVLEHRVYKFCPKSTSDIRIMDIVLDRSLFAGITPLTPEQGDDRGTSAETGAMLLLPHFPLFSSSHKARRPQLLFEVDNNGDE